MTAELVIEEGGFGLDLSFLEKRRPRIAMAGKRPGLEGVGRGGAGEKDSLWVGGGMEGEEGRRMVVRGKRDGGGDWRFPLDVVSVGADGGSIKK